MKDKIKYIAITILTRGRVSFCRKRTVCFLRVLSRICALPSQIFAKGVKIDVLGREKTPSPSHPRGKGRVVFLTREKRLKKC